MPSRVRFFISTPHGVIDGRKAFALLGAILRAVGVVDIDGSLVSRLRTASAHMPKKFKLHCFRVPRYTRAQNTEYWNALDKLKDSSKLVANLAQPPNVLEDFPNVVVQRAWQVPREPNQPRPVAQRIGNIPPERIR